MLFVHHFFMETKRTYFTRMPIDALRTQLTSEGFSLMWSDEYDTRTASLFFREYTPCQHDYIYVSVRPDSDIKTVVAKGKPEATDGLMRSIGIDPDVAAWREEKKTTPLSTSERGLRRRAALLRYRQGLR